MEQRLANCWRLTVNEKKFIESALLSEIRVDGRGPLDYRKLNIKFGRDDGSAEVQLGETRVMCFVSGQLVQPYRDRPNEGTFSIFTEFSPMADPSFEPGRPGESAVELGRIIDRGLRESRAIDTESLCILSAKLVWAIRVDIHILDNVGNLVDAANIAALASLMTFRRPECSLGGDDGQQVVVHPPEVREPLPLIIHHLPIAVTFGFFSNENLVVLDPTYHEEAVMTGRVTATLNANGDVCSIQKPGGQGVSQRVIMHCLKLAHVKAGDITAKIKDAVEKRNTERALQKIKRHSSSVAVDVYGTTARLAPKQNQSYADKDGSHLAPLKLKDEANFMECEATSSEEVQNNKKDESSKNFIGGPSSWDPYSECVNSDLLKSSLASRGQSTPSKRKDSSRKTKPEEPAQEIKADSEPIDDPALTAGQSNEGKTLNDAVKPKNKRKKKASSNNGN
ncbi:exosome complex component RRP45A-like [Vicia villosa]|uniref:exosome complex component RRP45A-like n=1 Tax=Vicia villosa TaxID=3911 RepID=UPI00273AB58E|nr:exosome complex component RRP45A-like [Vicia villosa]